MTHSLRRKLERGDFVVTAEICPPKGGCLDSFLAKARALPPRVDAVNVTDNQGGNMRISPLAAAAALTRAGIEPLMQLTCRDRNRLALQSELLGAAALGIDNVLALTGDHITCGDHPAAKPVFDLDSVQLLQAIRSLNGGADLAGKKLCTPTALFAGAAAAPEAEPFKVSLFKVMKKIEAGARFLQTQAVFDPERLQLFCSEVRPRGVRVIAGIFLLRSAATARFVNANIPGLRIPQEIVAELDAAADSAACGVEIARRTIADIRGLCDGVHLMVLGREEVIPRLLEGLS